METQSRMLSAFSSAGAQTRSGFAKLANGGFSTFVKIIMLVLTLYLVIISAVNIATYAYILRRPGNDADVNDTWCIALIVLNVITMIAALAIHIVVIISFFRKGGQKVAAVVDQATQDGAMRGAQMAARIEATNKAENAKIEAVENGSSKASADAIAQETFRREFNKKFNEYQQQIASSQTQNGTMQSNPSLDQSQVINFLQSLGVQLPVTQGY